MGHPDLPHYYGDNKIILMVRDPWTIYAYWEVKKDIEDEAREKMRRRGLDISRNILRVYDVTENDPDLDPKVVFDLELNGRAGDWYIHAVRPGREWMVDIGILSTRGDFFRLARSNAVRTPVHDMPYPYDENSATSGLFRGASSFER